MNPLELIEKSFEKIRVLTDEIEYAEIEKLTEKEKKIVRDHLEYLSKNFKAIANLYK